jgi:hypothetical protein
MPLLKFRRLNYRSATIATRKSHNEHLGILFEVIFNIQKICISVNTFHEEECKGNEDLMELQIPYVVLFTEKCRRNLFDS